MDANSPFDRKPPRERRAGAPTRVPLLERTWFRVGGLTVVAGWVIACVYIALRLAV
jgi:hypothetical protein